LTTWASSEKGTRLTRHIGLTRDAVLAGLVECADLLAGQRAGAHADGTWRDIAYTDTLRVLARIVGADRGSLMLMEDPHGELAIIASLGVPEDVAEQTRVPFGEAISGWVAEHGEPLLIAPEREIPDPVREAMHQSSTTSSVCAPIIWDGSVLGVVNMGRLDGARPFDDAHLQFAALAGGLLGHFLSLRRLRHETNERGLFVSQFIESIPSSMVVVDRRLRVVSANRHFLESVRLAGEAAMGRRLADVLPSWLTKYAPMEEKMREVFRTGEAFEGGDVLQVPTGNVYFFRLVPIMSGDVVQQAMLLVDDVTEQHRLGVEVRRTQRHLAGVVQGASDLLASLDQEGRIVTWNPAAEQVSGWTLNELRGRRLREICAPDDVALMNELLQRPLAERVGSHEVRLVAPDGREAIVDWSISPMTDDNGKVTGTVVVGRDLTSFRLMASQLVQSDKMASLGVMAGGIAHELRTPLAVIQVSAQLLMENPDDAELQATCLQKIDSSTKRSALIIDNLLKFARPQSELLSEVDVEAVLDETTLLLADQLALRRVRVSRATKRSGIRAVGNADLLQQVFTNLMLNACAAMPQGGKLSIAVRGENGGPVRIAFRDTGTGIPAADLPHLFDPFFTTRPPGSPSSGLGLAISYRIMEQHAGTIEVASEPKKGSTFTVSLPGRSGVMA